MKNLYLPLVGALLFSGLSQSATASQADDTAVAITDQTAGPTPFISKFRLTVSDLSVLKNIRFTIVPKSGSVTRPIAAQFSKVNLASRGYVDTQNGQITLPVFGLYDGYTNTVKLVYGFNDGSTKTASTTVVTAPFDDACDFNTPEIRQARLATTNLSFDFILAASACGVHSPTVLDTDGAVRWVGAAGIANSVTAFYDNGFYLPDGKRLMRLELDGTVRLIRDFSDLDVVGFHHNIDRGKYGIIIDVNTTSYIASIHYEIGALGKILKKWDLADIISKAMIAGGDDPSGFVRQAKGNYAFTAYEDWAHDNAVTYRKSDNSIIISSRENFVICVDYDTSAIKWILGDTTKQWYQYPSLKKYALAMTAGSIAPVGQHSVSITKDDNLLLFDNGQQSVHHVPRGPNRGYCAPRKYHIDTAAKTAAEIAHFTNNYSIRSTFRSSVYEDAADNYLVDYARAENPDGSLRAELIGLSAKREKVFDYSYPTTTNYNEAYRALPLHWENLQFIGPAAPPAAEPGTSDDGPRIR